MTESLIARQLKALLEADFTDPGDITTSIAPKANESLDSLQDSVHYEGVISNLKNAMGEFAKLMDNTASLKREAERDKDGTKTAELQSKLKEVESKFEALDLLLSEYKSLHEKTKSLLPTEVTVGVIPPAIPQ